jgi:hypothetical protein
MTMPDQPATVAVDRIEGDRAILDFGGELVEVPLAALPAGAAEGSLLTLSLVDAAPSIDEARARLERLRARSGSLDDFKF